MADMTFQHWMAVLALLMPLVGSLIQLSRIRQDLDRLLLFTGGIDRRVQRLETYTGIPLEGQAQGAK